MQKNTSTVVIAFLSGLVVAGGCAYMLSNVRRPPAPQQVSLEKPQTPAPAVQPDAVPSDASQAAVAEPAPVKDETPPPAASEPEKPEKRVATKHKPRPAVEQPASSPKPDEAAAAPQPAQAEVAQNVPPTAAPAATPVTTPTQPAVAPPVQSLNPPPDTQTAPPPAREPKTVTIASGTPITVRINERLSTNTNYAGDTFTASLDSPLIIDGFVIADKGSRVLGKVVRADKAGRVKGLSDLALSLTEIHTTDGQTVHIQTAEWDKQGPTSKKSDAAKVGGGAALGAIIGAIAGGGRGAAIGAGAGGAAGTGAVLTTRGKAAEIPAETRVTFSLDKDVSVTERLN